MEFWIVYLLIGVLAGVMAGLLGVGGGFIIVPALVLVFHRQGVDDAVSMHLAIGTSLASIVLTSLSSLYAHHRRGAVHWLAFRALTPGMVIGALVGAAIADLLPSHVLRVFFGVFVLVVALQIALKLMVSAQRHLPGRLGLAGAGGIVGAISAIVGIGGGSLTVPFLVWCNLSIRAAVATSSACGFPIAVAGATGFVIAGWNAAGLPPYSSGYLYWPAQLGIAIASVVFAPLGARWAHTLPTGILRRVFALFLAVIGVRMLIG